MSEDQPPGGSLAPGEQQVNGSLDEQLEAIAQGVTGFENMHAAIQQKVALLNEQSGRPELRSPDGKWVTLGTGSKPEDTPVLGIVQGSQITYIRRTTNRSDSVLYNGEGAPSQQEWAQNRVRDVGTFRRQRSPDGGRIVAVDGGGRVIIAPLNEKSAAAITDAGFVESSSHQFAGGEVRSDEVLLPGNMAYMAKENGSHTPLASPLDVSRQARSGDWQASVASLGPPDQLPKAGSSQAA